MQQINSNVNHVATYKKNQPTSRRKTYETYPRKKNILTSVNSKLDHLKKYLVNLPKLTKLSLMIVGLEGAENTLTRKTLQLSFIPS